jgi:hypothetical protein
VANGTNPLDPDSDKRRISGWEGYGVLQTAVDNLPDEVFVAGSASGITESFLGRLDTVEKLVARGTIGQPSTSSSICGSAWTVAGRAPIGTIDRGLRGADANRGYIDLLITNLRP